MSSNFNSYFFIKIGMAVRGSSLAGLKQEDHQSSLVRPSSCLSNCLKRCWHTVQVVRRCVYITLAASPWHHGIADCGHRGERASMALHTVIPVHAQVTFSRRHGDLEDLSAGRLAICLKRTQDDSQSLPSKAPCHSGRI